MANCIKANNKLVNVHVRNLGPRGPMGPKGDKGDKGDPGNVKPYISLRRLSNYLYEATFDALPDYVPSNEFSAYGCTSFVKDGQLHTNLDWYYGESAEFKINFGDVEGMSFITGLNAGHLEGNDDKLAQLPYRIRDGRNGAGLRVATHVLFNDFDYHGSGEKNADITLLPFLILTTMDSVDEVSDEVTNLITNCRITAAMEAQELLVQVLITDGITTKLFTPTENGYDYIDISSNPKLANFKWVNRATVSRSDADIQLRPTGIERWNSIDFDEVKLEDLRFTLAYESPDRLSEFIGIDETTKLSTDEELMAIYDKAHAEYLIRERDNKLWQTVHSIVYSSYKIDSLFVQEEYHLDYVIQETDIKANPLFEATVKLNKLRIRGITYSIAGGGASVYSNYQAFITNWNVKAKKDVELGWNIYVRTTDVPDLWVSVNDEQTSVPYTYVDDATFISDLNAAADVGLQIGYYRVNKLETEKPYIPEPPVKGALLGSTQATIDANGNIVIPISTSGTLGLVRIGNTLYGLSINSSGTVFVVKASDTEIQNRTNDYHPLVPTQINDVLVAGLTDANHIILDAIQQATARSVFGAGQTTIDYEEWDS